MASTEDAVEVDIENQLGFAAPSVEWVSLFLQILLLLFLYIFSTFHNIFFGRCINTDK